MKFTTPVKDEEANLYRNKITSDEGKRNIVIIKDVNVEEVVEDSVCFSNNVYERMEEIDSVIVEEAIANKEEWFRGTTASDAFLKRCYSPIKDIVLIPQFKLFEHDKVLSQSQELGVGMVGDIAVEISSMTFGKASFGANVNLVQMILKKQEETKELDYPEECIF